MYKVFTSLWSKSTSQKPSKSSIDDGSWIFVSDNGSTMVDNQNPLANSLIKSNEPPEQIQSHFNPIEDLLIEHASMSVYEDIASKTRQRNSVVQEEKLNELSEDDDDDDEAVEDPNVNSIAQHRMSNSSLNTMDSSSSSLLAHHRHLHRLHQRRKQRSSKVIWNHSHLDESKQVLNKPIDRLRLNHSRSTKMMLPLHS